jgi:hypothetical protein
VFDAAPCERPTSAPCPEAAQSNAITAIAVPAQEMDAKSADGRGGAQVSGRLAGFCASKHTCFMTAALILNLVFWGLTVSFILAVSDMLGLDGKFDNPVVNIMAFFMVTVYIIHWILIYISPIAAHLNAESIDGLDALEAHVQQLHQTPPRIVMSIVCSHSESSSSTDSDGNSTTISETVVTHRAEQQFQYDDVTDVSAPFVVPLQNDTVRLELTARSTFADAYTAQLFDAEYRVFIAKNTRDVDVQHWRGLGGRVAGTAWPSTAVCRRGLGGQARPGPLRVPSAGAAWAAGLQARPGPPRIPSAGAAWAAGLQARPGPPRYRLQARPGRQGCRHGLALHGTVCRRGLGGRVAGTAWPSTGTVCRRGLGGGLQARPGPLRYRLQARPGRQGCRHGLALYGTVCRRGLGGRVAGTAWPSTDTVCRRGLRGGEYQVLSGPRPVRARDDYGRRCR